MASITEQIRRNTLNVCDSLAAAEAGSGSDSLASVIARLDDGDLEVLLRDAAAARSEFDAVITVGAGVIAKRSERELSYAGLAQREGYRTPAAMVQSLTGSSRTEAGRQVRLGEAMGEADAAADLIGTHLIEPGPIEPGRIGVEGSVLVEDGVAAVPVPVLSWFEPLTRAVAEHSLTSEAVAAAMRGLGEPNERCGVETLRAAAKELLTDTAGMDTAGMNTAGMNAAGMNADELLRHARWARDRIDPAGVSLRAEERYAARTWRFSRTEGGARTGWVQFDDESAAWIDAIVAAGMRPRRGGPRFVDPAEAQTAKRLTEDPRTNDQLVFDLLMDVLRAGAQADPSLAFGSRQPGIRIVITQENLNQRDHVGNLTGTGFMEDTGNTVPPAMLERMLCEVGTRDITVDKNGCPFDVGREQRLFTAKQRIALSIRCGGCMVNGCDPPPSYTEAHHIDEWKTDHGRTDTAQGLLLCRYDHMRIHNQHWKIKRAGSAYWMIPPPGIDPKQTPIRLHSKSPLRYPPLRYRKTG